MPMVIIMMGVSGSGKSHLGRLLAKELSVPFYDGDDYHLEASIEKMTSGIPLEDDDRLPWLHRLNLLARENEEEGCVIACSALKQAYRNSIAKSIETAMRWVYLKGTFEQITSRMENRQGHFMKAELLKSQFDILEEPTDAQVIDIAETAKEIIERIKNQIDMKSEIGLIGLGVMGRSLSRNLARNGFKLSMYNRHVAGVEENVAASCMRDYPELDKSKPFDELKSFVQSIDQPRKIILMVNAGPTVDIVLNDLSELLDKGDIVIDGGNSHFADTDRRIAELKEKGLHFIGTGVSGGEEGALNGPSIMPSGEKEAYDHVSQYLEAIAAKDDNGDPCCTYVGAQGSGHFVKMIHNGIEYAEMQLIAECYSILQNQGHSNPEIASEFESWMTESASYLLQISIDILKKRDGDGYLLDNILDKAGNKGTGKWTTVTIADFGEPATMIPAALFARYLSFFKEKRQTAERTFGASNSTISISKDAVREAYQFARTINHHQGFSLISRVSDQNDWNIDLSGLARIWTGGCIIKSDFMKDLVVILKTHASLLSHDKIQQVLTMTHASAQSVAADCIKNELHIPCLLEATNFFHGFKTANSSANMIQAQRDYFGAHTYERKDDLSGKKYHTEW